ncbi:class I SAM-dependent methyltransferase [Nocardia sp. NPDC057353]|uniref:class I SAM-dependent methyltransferase n=1 Tax=Nocardia sp. NPDC057353 TaxID=3346104 RepID=UPI003638572F
MHPDLTGANTLRPKAQTDSRLSGIGAPTPWYRVGAIPDAREGIRVVESGMDTSASDPSGESARVVRVFDHLADGYDRQITWSERLLLGDARRWAVAAARGEVVEIGTGTGLNLPAYGPDVTRVTGIDISAAMLDRARARLNSAEIDQDRFLLRHGDAQALALPDEVADTVVSTYALCSIPDPAAAVAEAWRVLRPGGAFVLAEHGLPDNRFGAALLRAAEPLAVRLSADHLSRDPLPLLRQAGFELEQVARSGRGNMVVRALARKPLSSAIPN